MTIKRGEEWGSSASPPIGLRIACDDAELHRLLNRAGRTERPPLDVGLVTGGGDLARTVAASRSARQLQIADELVRLPIDIGRAEFDGRTVWFASHLVIRRPGWRAWRGPLTALMNAQFIGVWDVAPRGHPNDGRLDVIATRGTLGLRQRFHARSRLVTGTHLPHPALSESRVRQWQGSVEAGETLILDGVAYEYCGDLSVVVEPDSMIVYI